MEYYEFHASEDELDLLLNAFGSLAIFSENYSTLNLIKGGGWNSSNIIEANSWLYNNTSASRTLPSNNINTRGGFLVAKHNPTFNTLNDSYNITDFENPGNATQAETLINNYCSVANFDKVSLQHDSNPLVLTFGTLSSVTFASYTFTSANFSISSGTAYFLYEVTLSCVFTGSGNPVTFSILKNFTGCVILENISNLLKFYGNPSQIEDLLNAGVRMDHVENIGEDQLYLNISRTNRTGILVGGGNSRLVNVV